MPRFNGTGTEPGTRALRVKSWGRTGAAVTAIGAAVASVPVASVRHRQASDILAGCPRMSWHRRRRKPLSLRATSLRGVELDGSHGALTHHPREQRPRVVVALRGPREQRPNAGDHSDLELPRGEARHLRGLLRTDATGEAVNLCHQGIGAHAAHVALVERWQHHNRARRIEAGTGHQGKAGAQHLPLHSPRAASVLGGIEARKGFNDPCLCADDGRQRAHIALVYGNRAEALRGSDEAVNGGHKHVAARHRSTLPHRRAGGRATRVSPRSNVRADARGMGYRR